MKTIKELEKQIVELKELLLKEREECAKICDEHHYKWRWDNEPDSASGPRECAASIRARSI